MLLAGLIRCVAVRPVSCFVHHRGSCALFPRRLVFVGSKPSHLGGEVVVRIPAGLHLAEVVDTLPGRKMPRLLCDLDTYFPHLPRIRLLCSRSHLQELDPLHRDTAFDDPSARFTPRECPRHTSTIYS